MKKSITILMFGAVLILGACELNTMTGAKFQPVDSAPGGGGNGPPWDTASRYGGGTRH